MADARPDKDYKKGHIPGAINVQWPYFTNQEGKPGEKDWGMLLPEKELSKKLSSLGIDKNKASLLMQKIKVVGEKMEE
ncbi:rhodanese-like domain-containing protein [Clostridium botulinum]|nr:rhodanese-like domain-containing protein [Clostridium botulinum]